MVSAYRAFVLDEQDAIVERREIVAANNSDALESARKLVDGHDVEVWQRTHIIGRLKHKPHSG